MPGRGAYFAINPLSSRTHKRHGRGPLKIVARGVVGRGRRRASPARRPAFGRGHRSFAAARRIGTRVSIGPIAHDVRSASSATGVVLVGDAAGFLNPFTGQGVYLALASARAAANAIERAFAREGQRDTEFARYASERARELAVRRRLAAAVGLLVDVPFLARRAASRLHRRPGLGAVLMGALGGTQAPQSALGPGVLGRLVV